MDLVMQSFPLDESFTFLQCCRYCYIHIRRILLFDTKLRRYVLYRNHDQYQEYLGFEEEISHNFATFVNARKYLNFLINYNDHC